MNLAMAYHSGDRDQTIQWLEWVKEIGGLGSHKLFLMRAFDCKPIPEILPFTDVKDEEQTKEAAGQLDWSSTEPMRSASAPNSMFRQFAWKFYLQKLGHWMFIEPDCIPLVSGWHDKIESEYLKCGKPFFGAHVLIESVPEHLSGNSVYPFNVPERAPTLVQRTEWKPKDQPRYFELAFDVAGARETVPQSCWTNLIQHKFRYEGFKSRKQFNEVIDSNAVVFHSCKDGSIYKYLRGGDDTHVIAPSTVQTPKAQGEITPLPQNDISETLKTSIKSRAMIESFPAVKSETSVQNGSTRTYSYSDILERVVDQSSGLPPVSEPWKNKTESEQEVRLLCSALALFAKAPIYKARVRQALREAKIIK